MLIRQHGFDAWFVASQRADALLDQGDMEGFEVWKRIVAAVSILGRETPSASEPIN